MVKMHFFYDQKYIGMWDGSLVPREKETVVIDGIVYRVDHVVWESSQFVKIALTFVVKV